MFACFTVLHTMVVLTAIRCLLTQNYESFAICILTLALFLLPALIEERMDISIPPLFQAIIFLFIFAAEILGEVDHYYVKIPGWDTALAILSHSCRVLLLYDDRRRMGVFRMRHGQVLPF